MSQQTASQPPSSAVQKVAVPIQAPADVDMMGYLTDPSDTIPKWIREKAFWGYANRFEGLGKYNKKQAEAQILRAENMVALYNMSLPAWKVKPSMITDYENFLNYVKVSVWRATTDDPRHERGLLASQGSFSQSTSTNATPIPQTKKRFWRIF